MIQSIHTPLAIVLVATLAACGGGGGGGSYGSIVAAIEAPTGTVDADTVLEVALQFEAAESAESGVAFASQAGGSVAARRKQSSQDYSSFLCDAGGNATASSSSDGRTSTITYDDCCSNWSYVQCCQTGRGTSYYAGSLTGASATEGVYDLCMDIELTIQCGAEVDEAQTQACYDGAGNVVYVVHVEGASFAVRGDYSDGNGELEITGANGTYDCTFRDGEAGCVGDDGTRFET